jgi:hypothetical protein
MKRGPKPEGGIHRVRLGGYGPSVRKDVDEIIMGICKEKGISIGRFIDNLVEETERWKQVAETASAEREHNAMVAGELRAKVAALETANR